MYGIFWSVLAKPEAKTELVTFLLDDGVWSLANEVGTLRFDVYEDAQDADRIWVYEAYTNPDAFRVHRGGEYFGRFMQDISKRCIQGGIETAMPWSNSIEVG